MASTPTTRTAKKRAAPHPFRAAPEHRWPVAVAMLVAILLYVLLPSGFVGPLRYAVAGLGLLMLIPLIVLNPTHLSTESRLTRMLSIGIGLLLLLGNQVALVALVIELVSASRSDGSGLLVAAVQVWVTNIIAFSLIYWEMDRGGPVARRREARKDLPAADFRFPQDENDDNVDEVARKSSKVADWMPSYFDYLYFSFSDAMAFSATDVMPLTHRAKALMLVESLAGFVILALVIARSVNLLGS